MNTRRSFLKNIGRAFLASAAMCYQPKLLTKLVPVEDKDEHLYYWDVGVGKSKSFQWVMPKGMSTSLGDGHEFQIGQWEELALSCEEEAEHPKVSEERAAKLREFAEGCREWGSFDLAEATKDGKLKVAVYTEPTA